MSERFLGEGFDINKLIAAIGVKTGEYAEIIRVKAELFSLRKQKGEALMSLGRVVYKMQRRGSFDQKKIYDLCNEITDIDKQIDIKEEEINHIHETAKKAIKKKNGNIKDKHKHKKHTLTGLIEAEKYSVDTID